MQEGCNLLTIAQFHSPVLAVASHWVGVLSVVGNQGTVLRRGEGGEQLYLVIRTLLAVFAVDLVVADSGSGEGGQQAAGAVEETTTVVGAQMGGYAVIVSASGTRVVDPA